ncbi:hypothetical protein [Solibacillus silvestris]|uniref:hypothetical protein n=1 Tax=Solibacillus silvestris TaxID=76853 RepID=UPI00130532F3|nr:hypothetical protein [Solibacillus silvestris]
MTANLNFFRGIVQQYGHITEKHDLLIEESRPIVKDQELITTKIAVRITLLLW